MDRLPRGTVLHCDTGDPLKVLGLLGAGGQGEVYEVDQGGARYALKWYYPPPRDARAQAQSQEQRAAIRTYIIPKGAPDHRFLWPLSFVDGEPGTGTFGYVMRLFDPGFETLERLVCGRTKTDDRTLATAALGIVDAFRKLHLSGAVYKDINLGGFAFHPATGDVLVVDNDNVRTNGAPGAILFPGFGAPEVVMGRAPCTTQTDDHSLAVLLFYMFCRGNPMEGRKELVNCYDAAATRTLFGDEATFVFDPSDESNRPVVGVHDSVLRNWRALPTPLRTAFTRAFTEGLHDPSRRLTDGEWIQTLSTFRDALFECSHCRRETAYDREVLKAGEQLKCAWCQKPLATPSRMKVGAQVVVLSPRTRLYPHHLGDTADFSSVVAEVSAHPSKPGVWGLKNLSTRPFSYTGADGATHTVATGQTAPIRDGLSLQIGRVQASIKALRRRAKVGSLSLARFCSSRAAKALLAIVVLGSAGVGCERAPGLRVATSGAQTSTVARDGRARPASVGAWFSGDGVALLDAERTLAVCGPAARSFSDVLAADSGKGSLSFVNRRGSSCFVTREGLAPLRLEGSCAITSFRDTPFGAFWTTDTDVGMVVSDKVVVVRDVLSPIVVRVGPHSLAFRSRSEVGSFIEFYDADDAGLIRERASVPVDGLVISMVGVPDGCVVVHAWSVRDRDRLVQVCPSGATTLAGPADAPWTHGSLDDVLATDAQRFFFLSGGEVYEWERGQLPENVGTSPARRIGCDDVDVRQAESIAVVRPRDGRSYLASRSGYRGIVVPDAYR